MQVLLVKKQESVVYRPVAFMARIVQPKCIALISHDHGKKEGFHGHLRLVLSRHEACMAYEKAKHSKFKW